MNPSHSRKTVPALACALLLSLATASTAAAGESPLVGWWPLMEGSGQTVRDISGNGANGELGSTSVVDEHDPAWIRGSRLGWALEFDGDDYIRIPRNAKHEVQRMTVSLWFRASESPGTYRYLISKGGEGCLSASWGLETGHNGGLGFYIWNGTQQRWSGMADTSVWDGRWHHAAGTFDGVNVRLFIDGKQVGGGSDLQGVEIKYDLEQQDATLGAYRGSCNLMFAGALDQVSLWSTALPVDRIWNTLGWVLGRPTAW